MLDQLPSAFLGLPQELQDRIHRDHYECAAIMVRWEPQVHPQQNPHLVFEPLPNLNIELVSRKIHTDARRTRDTWWPRILTVTRSGGDGLGSTRLDMIFGCPVRSAVRYTWLCQRIEEITAQNVLYRYETGESCFAWPMLLHSMPRLCRFTFSTWKNLSITDKKEARKFLVSVDQGAQDDHILDSVHRFGTGDLPGLLRDSRRLGWSVMLVTTLCFKSADGSSWYQRMLQVDFDTMRTISRDTMVDDVDLLSDVSENGDEETTQFGSNLPVQHEAN